MVPDMLIGNVRFLESLSEEEREIFYKASDIATEVERKAWLVEVERAKQEAEKMGVEFRKVDVERFKEKVLPLQKQLVEENEKLRPIYERIQEINKEEEND